MAYILKQVHLENTKAFIGFVLFSPRIQMSLSCPQEPTKLEADLSWPFLPLEDVVWQVGGCVFHFSQLSR